jgi:hypothetical protein
VTHIRPPRTVSGLIVSRPARVKSSTSLSTKEVLGLEGPYVPKVQIDGASTLGRVMHTFLYPEDRQARTVLGTRLRKKKNSAMRSTNSTPGDK